MSDSPLSTEAKILAAAERTFLKVGFSGARMQQIADEAGINKALLHYYYRNKEQLYQRVFDAAYAKFSGALEKLDDATLSLEQKVEAFVIEVWKLTSEHPSLLMFLSAEISRGMPVVVARRFNLHRLHFSQQLAEKAAQGTLPRQEPLLVLLQLFSLCFYPIQSGALLTNLLEVSETEYKVSLRTYYEGIPRLLFTGMNTIQKV